MLLAIASVVDFCKSALVQTMTHMLLASGYNLLALRATAAIVRVACLCISVWQCGCLLVLVSLAIEAAPGPSQGDIPKRV